MTFQILIDRFIIYLKYYFKAKTIYHIQSPLLFDFISNVFDQDQSYYAFYTIDAAYDSISNSQKTIPTDEFSNSHQQNGKSLAQFASTAASPKKISYDLFRLVEFQKAKAILEMGSCVGLSSLSMALVSNDCTVTSIEGNTFLAQESRELHQRFGVKNIKLHNQLFSQFFESRNNEKFDIILIDGDHNYQSTMNYIRHCLSALNENGIIIMDDIHWSKEMYKAWLEIQSMTEFTTSLECLRWGILFTNRNLSPQKLCYIKTIYKPWQIGLFA